MFFLFDMIHSFDYFCNEISSLITYKTLVRLLTNQNI